MVTQILYNYKNNWIRVDSDVPIMILWHDGNRAFSVVFELKFNQMIAGVPS
jgi:hypothetical protein